MAASLAMLGALCPTTISAQLPFFPGAEGYGGSFSGTPPAGGWFSNATVYRVTRLDDDLGPDGKGAPGTLRGAFRENTTNKIIIFDVAGTINLTNGKLDIKNLSNYYVAGQTAPGPVTIYGDMTQLTHSGGKENRNVVLRYLSFRKGTGDNDDSITFAGSGLGTHLILDHVSASWSEDEIISVANNNTNVTVQYSLIHDALVSNHAYGSLIRPRISSNVTFHHNLYANNASRQARFGTYNGELLTADFRNNVVYNWRDRASYAGGSSESDREKADVNFVGNYFIAGPGTGSNTTKTFIVDRNIDVRAYQADNFVDSDKSLNPGGQPNGADTGWGMWQVSSTTNPGTLQQMATPFPMPPVTTQSANDAYWQIINHVGNWWWDRDAIDSRVVNNVLNNTNAPNGIGASAPPAAEINGLLAAPQISHPAGWDTDGDGMPDWWEIAHGLNPNNSSDWNQDFSNNGYINLIKYINERGEFPAPAPIVFNGATNSRYALITNWRTDDGGITAGSNWQPSKYDEAQINSGTVVVDSVGQHAGLLILGANPGDNATLDITSGWLKVADALVIGGDDAATATLNLSGGMLSAPVLAQGAGGSFNFTGGVLHAQVIGFDLQNQGGLFAPGNSLGAAHVMGDLALSSGTLQIEVASAAVADALLVDGSVTLGGNLDISLLGGFSPSDGDHWQIIAADGGISGAFSSVTPGYSVQQQGNNLTLYFGAAPPIGLVGDINGDGVVDAADYVAWRKDGGTSEEYAAWRAHFGETNAGGASAASAQGVPEPSMWILMLFAVAIVLSGGRRGLRVSGSFLQK